MPGIQKFANAVRAVKSKAHGVTKTTMASPLIGGKINMFHYNKAERTAASFLGKNGSKAALIEQKGNKGTFDYFCKNIPNKYDRQDIFRFLMTLIK